MRELKPATASTHDRPVHPGALLRAHVLPALHLSVSQAARDLVITRQTLHRILAGEAAITPDMALRLERLCGVHSGFWLHCQHQYERHRLQKTMADLLRCIPARRLPPDIIEQIGAHDAH